MHTDQTQSLELGDDDNDEVDEEGDGHEEAASDGPGDLVAS